MTIANMEDDQIEKATFTLQEDNVPEAVPLKPGRHRMSKKTSKPKSKCARIIRRPITIIAMGVAFIIIAIIFFFSLYADLKSMQNSTTKNIKDHGKWTCKILCFYVGNTSNVTSVILNQIMFSTLCNDMCCDFFMKMLRLVGLLRKTSL